MAIYYCHMFRQEEEVLIWEVPVSAAGCTARFSSTSNEVLERRGGSLFQCPFVGCIGSRFATD